MSIVVNGITAAERWEGYRKGRSDRGPTVTKEYDVPYASADAFVDAMMGGCSSPYLGGIITRIGRHACPENPTLLAVEASYEGLAERDTTGGSTPQFERAVVTVTYGVLSWDEQPDPKNSFPNSNQPFVYAIQEIDFADEFVTLGNGEYFLAGTSRKIDDASVGRHIGNATLRFTRKHVPWLATELILSKTSKLNNAVLFGAPIGQILFKGARTHREASSDGTKTQEVELVFMWREQDWNKVATTYHASGFDFVVDGSGNKPYQYTDLMPLLT
jgi:hypothetical protein